MQPARIKKLDRHWALHTSPSARETGARGVRMFAVYDCIANAHDLKLVGLAAIICGLASFPAIRLLHHVRKSTGQMRLCLARGLRHVDRLRHLGDAFHRHAGVLAGHPERLQHRADLCCRWSRRSLLTGIGLGRRGRRIHARAALAGRRDRRRRHRGDALYRHGGFRDPGPASSGIRSWSIASIVLGALIGAAALPVGLRRRAVKCETARRAAADRGDLQPPFHGDGRRLDHARSDGRSFRRRRCRQAGSPSPSRSRASSIIVLALARRRPRHARPATRANWRPIGCAASPTPPSRAWSSATARPSSTVNESFRGARRLSARGAWSARTWNVLSR